MRLARGVREGKSLEQVQTELAEAMMEPLVLWGVLLLVGSFLTVILLVVVAVTERFG